MGLYFLIPFIISCAKETKIATVLYPAGEDNSHHYFVASQDSRLRDRLRRLAAAVPLLHMIRNTMVLEKPSESTHDRAEQVDYSVVH